MTWPTTQVRPQPKTRPFQCMVSRHREAIPTSWLAVVPTDPPHQYGDVSSFVFDYHKKEYYATIKMFFSVNDTAANYSLPRRSVGVSRTADPSSWPQPTRSLTPDEIDDRWASSAAARLHGNRTELYGLSAFAYQTQVRPFFRRFVASQSPKPRVN